MQGLHRNRFDRWLTPSHHDILCDLPILSNQHISCFLLPRSDTFVQLTTFAWESRRSRRLGEGQWSRIAWNCREVDSIGAGFLQHPGIPSTTCVDHQRAHSSVSSQESESLSRNIFFWVEYGVSRDNCRDRFCIRSMVWPAQYSPLPTRHSHSQSQLRLSLQPVQKRAQESSSSDTIRFLQHKFAGPGRSQDDFTVTIEVHFELQRSLAQVTVLEECQSLD